MLYMYTRLDLKMVTDEDRRREKRLDSTPWQGGTQIRTPTAKAASCSARIQTQGDGHADVLPERGTEDSGLENDIGNLCRKYEIKKNRHYHI